MTAPAIAWLESRYEVISAALAKVRLSEPLGAKEREALREACIERAGPPRPAAGHRGKPGWHWRPGEKAGPLDGRAHP